MDTVERAFSGVEVVEIYRPARLVKACGAADQWRSPMRQGAVVVMEEWHADLAIVGLVKVSGESLGLRFVRRSGGDTLHQGDQTYRLVDVTLGPDFHDHLQVQLTAHALVAQALLGGTEARDQVLNKTPEDFARKLSILLKSTAIDDPDHQAALQVALGVALTTQSWYEDGNVHLLAAYDLPPVTAAEDVPLKPTLTLLDAELSP